MFFGWEIRHYRRDNFGANIKRVLEKPHFADLSIMRRRKALDTCLGREEREIAQILLRDEKVFSSHFALLYCILHTRGFNGIPSGHVSNIHSFNLEIEAKSVAFWESVLIDPPVSTQRNCTSPLPFPISVVQGGVQIIKALQVLVNIFLYFPKTVLQYVLFFSVQYLSVVRFRERAGGRPRSSKSSPIILRD